MKRFQEIFAKNIVANENKDCPNCPDKENCPSMATIEDVLESMKDDEDYTVLENSVKEWYEEKTGQKLD